MWLRIGGLGGVVGPHGEQFNSDHDPAAGSLTLKRRPTQGVDRGYMGGVLFLLDRKGVLDVWLSPYRKWRQAYGPSSDLIGPVKMCLRQEG